MDSTYLLTQAVVTFLALAALLRWRHRREDGPHRLRRGLRTYVAAGQADRMEPAVEQYRVGSIRTRIAALIGLQQETLGGVR